MSLNTISSSSSSSIYPKINESNNQNMNKLLGITSIALSILIPLGHMVIKGYELSFYANPILAPTSVCLFVFGVFLLLLTSKCTNKSVSISQKNKVTHHSGYSVSSNSSSYPIGGLKIKNTIPSPLPSSFGYMGNGGGGYSSSSLPSSYPSPSSNFSNPYGTQTHIPVNGATTQSVLHNPTYSSNSSSYVPPPNTNPMHMPVDGSKNSLHSSSSSSSSSSKPIHMPLDGSTTQFPSASTHYSSYGSSSSSSSSSSKPIHIPVNGSTNPPAVSTKSNWGHPSLSTVKGVNISNGAPSQFTGHNSLPSNFSSPSPGQRMNVNGGNNSSSPAPKVPNVIHPSTPIPPKGSYASVASGFMSPKGSSSSFSSGNPPRIAINGANNPPKIPNPNQRMPVNGANNPNQ